MPWKLVLTLTSHNLSRWLIPLTNRTAGLASPSYGRIRNPLTTIIDCGLLHNSDVTIILCYGEIEYRPIVTVHVRLLRCDYHTFEILLRISLSNRKIRHITPKFPPFGPTLSSTLDVTLPSSELWPTLNLQIQRGRRQKAKRERLQKSRKKRRC